MVFCPGFSIAWTLGPLLQLGLDSDAVALLADASNGQPIDAEWAAALAFVYRTNDGIWFGPPVSWFVANLTSPGRHWQQLDEGPIGCAADWKPFPGRAEARAALQRYALREMAYRDPRVKFATSMHGLALDVQHEQVLPWWPSDETSLADYVLLQLSEPFRWFKGVQFDWRSPGRFEARGRGPMTWDEIERWF